MEPVTTLSCTTPGQFTFLSFCLLRMTHLNPLPNKIWMMTLYNDDLWCSAISHSLYFIIWWVFHYGFEMLACYESELVFIRRSPFNVNIYGHFKFLLQVVFCAFINLNLRLDAIFNNSLWMRVWEWAGYDELDVDFEFRVRVQPGRNWTDWQGSIFCVCYIK